MNEIILLPLKLNNKSLLIFLKTQIARITGLPVTISNPVFDTKPFYNAERAQYDASKIIEYVEKQKFPLSIVCTSVDLFIPIFTYVFGLARLNGNTAIVSTHRLENQFYGLKDDPERLEQRFLKEIVHELGHLAGLRHCPQSNCVMASSASADDLDIKNNFYCKSCLKQLMNPDNNITGFLGQILNKVDKTWEF